MMSEIELGESVCFVNGLKGVVFMKLFKKIVCTLFSLLALCSPCVLAGHDKVPLGGDPCEFRVLCVRSGSQNVVEIGGGIGRYFIHHPNIREYAITDTTPCQRKICDIITRSSNEYLLEFEEKSTNYWNRWRILKPEGCSYWILTPYGGRDIYRRKVYIKKIPRSDAWNIEAECIIGSEIIKIPLAIVHFGPGVGGEIMDIINFLAAIIYYPEFRNFVS